MHKHKRKDYFLHPFEMGFAGLSQSGKTTLLSTLVEHLKAHFQIGFVKHSHHGFSMDQAGKDTAIMYEAGSSMVAIQDNTNWVYRENNERFKPTLRNLLIHHDMVLIEGYKDKVFPKVVYLDESLSILQYMNEEAKRDIIFYVGNQSAKPSELNDDKTFFNAENISGIAHGLLNFFQKQIDTAPLYGLLLCGGKSSRMGQDKSTLKYHNEDQVAHYTHLMSEHVTRVFVSNRFEQAPEKQFGHEVQIHDRFLHMGPLGGILSAMEEHPKAAWLVMAIDMPLVQKKHIEHLLSERNPFKAGTVFINHAGLPEPLFSLIEPKAKALFYQMLSDGENCPRHFFKLHKTKHITVEDDRFLMNFNTPQDMSSFKA